MSVGFGCGSRVQERSISQNLWKSTVVVIEHNLDVIKQADWVIDMGPEGGRGGGQLLIQGTPEQVAASGVGYTSAFIAEELNLE